jgi:hypothetical protein
MSFPDSAIPVLQKPRTRPVRPAITITALSETRARRNETIRNANHGGVAIRPPHHLHHHFFESFERSLLAVTVWNEVEWSYNHFRWSLRVTMRPSIFPPAVFLVTAVREFCRMRLIQDRAFSLSLSREATYVRVYESVRTVHTQTRAMGAIGRPAMTRRCGGFFWKAGGAWPCLQHDRYLLNSVPATGFSTAADQYIGEW